ncbi:MAG: hypothetical protein Unbinned2691contig1000_59 [Prokaryotic dsDNA virus sp.]|nr:MAG: hypothetical protein Unbinned2691contig1000_59 [Prokaryotic dsDNA virus sp.]|tara:strand:- start:13446 stop:13673 length:228 start_codon:yes stop_codon:yes gene_type:complete
MGNRCSHQRINTNIKVGSGRATLSTRAANNLEVDKINTAIAALKKAKTCDNHDVLLNQITEAFRITREIARSRIV